MLMLEMLTSVSHYIRSSGGYSINLLGVWRHEECLARKALQTTTDDVWEIMPESCVLNVRANVVNVKLVIL